MLVLGHCKSLVSAPSATTGPRPCTVMSNVIFSKSLPACWSLFCLSLALPRCCILPVQAVQLYQLQPYQSHKAETVVWSEVGFSFKHHCSSKESAPGGWWHLRPWPLTASTEVFLKGAWSFQLPVLRSIVGVCKLVVLNIHWQKELQTASDENSITATTNHAMQFARRRWQWHYLLWTTWPIGEASIYKMDWAASASPVCLVWAPVCICVGLKKPKHFCALLELSNTMFWKRQFTPMSPVYLVNPIRFRSLCTEHRDGEDIADANFLTPNMISTLSRER